MARARLVSKGATPRYEHDCDECRFLGRMDEFDLYRCESAQPLKQSHIARSGSRGPEYSSMPASFTPAGSVYALCAELYARLKDGRLSGPCAWTAANRAWM
jgi:hypothetical protein